MWEESSSVPDMCLLLGILGWKSLIFDIIELCASFLIARKLITHSLKIISIINFSPTLLQGF